MNEVKLGKEEKALIRAYVRFRNTKSGGIKSSLYDAIFLETELTMHILERTDLSYRHAVRDYIRPMLRSEFKLVIKGY